MTIVKVRRPPLVMYPVPECYHGTRIPDYGIGHTTEGLGTVESLGAYFARTPDRLCSTFAVERTGRAGMYVANMAVKTYHVANHNSQCYGIEQFGYARTSRDEWLTKYRRQLYMTAWIFAWADYEVGLLRGGDPITTQKAGSEKTGRTFTHSEGLSQHRWVPDNDHDDCGTGYPWDLVSTLAIKWAKTGGPTLSTRIYIATGHRPA